MFIYQPLLPTQLCAQNGFCCNAFCSDSTRTRPLCSSFLHVSLFREGLQPFYFAALFLEQVHSLIQLLFCCIFSTSTFLPWAGSCCICLLTCSFINRCCQHDCAHRMGSAAMLSEMIRLVPIHFVAVVFHAGLFWEGLGLQPFYLAALFLEQVHSLIQLSFCRIFSLLTFLPWAGSCCMCLLIYQLLLSTQLCAQNGFCCNAFCNDSTRAHPLCSSCLSCRFVLGGFAVYLLYLPCMLLFRPGSAFLFLRVLLLPVAACSFLLELVPGGD